MTTKRQLRTQLAAMHVLNDEFWTRLMRAEQDLAVWQNAYQNLANDRDRERTQATEALKNVGIRLVS